MIIEAGGQNDSIGDTLVSVLLCRLEARRKKAEKRKREERNRCKGLLAIGIHARLTSIFSVSPSDRRRPSGAPQYRAWRREAISVSITVLGILRDGKRISIWVLGLPARIAACSTDSLPISAQ
jgi:hypothetical protein